MLILPFAFDFLSLCTCPNHMCVFVNNNKFDISFSNIPMKYDCTAYVCVCVCGDCVSILFCISPRLYTYISFHLHKKERKEGDSNYKALLKLEYHMFSLHLSLSLRRKWLGMEIVNIFSFFIHFRRKRVNIFLLSCRSLLILFKIFPSYSYRVMR